MKKKIIYITILLLSIVLIIAGCMYRTHTEYYQDGSIASEEERDGFAIPLIIDVNSKHTTERKGK